MEIERRSASTGATLGFTTGENGNMENQSARSQHAGGKQFMESARGSIEGVGSTISESAAHSKEVIGAAAKAATNSAGADLQSLQADIDGLKDTVTKFMTQAAEQTAKSARKVSSDLADRGTAMASTATRQAKTFASEFESMVRRNPVGAIAGAVAIGVLIGALGRRS
jgi:ElaB/YqjD/DUF883 family membrane-anchored ribosome-binding protein